MESCGSTGKMYKAADDRLWKMRMPFWVLSEMLMKQNFGERNRKCNKVQENSRKRYKMGVDKSLLRW